MKICPICGEYEGSPWWTALCEYAADKAEEEKVQAARNPQAWSVLAEGLDGEAGMKR